MAIAVAPVQQGMDFRGKDQRGMDQRAFENVNWQKVGMAELEQHDRMQIQEMRQWLEAFTGYERNNRYVIRNDQGQNKFFVQEKSSCFERNFCHGDCKAWRMDVYHLGHGELSEEFQDKTPFIHLERPFTLTLCCYERPKVIVTDMNTGAQLGEIHEPFGLCRPFQLQVRSPTGQDVLHTEAQCFQPGLCLPLPCEGIPCNTVDFPVLDAQNGQQVAHIEKQWKWGDFCKCHKDWDKFDVDFPGMNSENKGMLLATALSIQMRWFDKRNGDTSNPEQMEETCFCQLLSAGLRFAGNS
mmetsp:Transcript_15962/g.36552  ORF Transcript_15962/g.36552 Transcript_15962/m.36552 type:complete len:297 (+) Transcript_15962:51-941(+)